MYIIHKNYILKTGMIFLKTVMILYLNVINYGGGDKL